MPWCPNCGSEYREGVSRCAECGAGLVAERPARAVCTDSRVGDGGRRTLAAIAQGVRKEPDWTARRWAAFLGGLLLLPHAAHRAYRLTSARVLVLGFALFYGIVAVWWVAHGLGALYGDEGILWHVEGYARGRMVLWSSPDHIPSLMVRSVVDPLSNDLAGFASAASRALEPKLGPLRARGVGIRWAVWTGETVTWCASTALLLAAIYAWLAAAVTGHGTGLRQLARTARAAFAPLFGWELLLTALFAAAYMSGRYITGAVGELAGAEWNIRIRSTADALSFPFLFAPFLAVTRQYSLRRSLAGSLRVLARRAAMVAGLVLAFHLGNEVAGMLAGICGYLLQVLVLPPELVQLHSPLVGALSHLGILARPLSIFLGGSASMCAFVVTVGLRVSLTIGLLLIALRTPIAGAAELPTVNEAAGPWVSSLGHLRSGGAAA